MPTPRSRLLVVMRHAKSDWTHDVPDRRRPLGKRGRRQAAEAGAWLAAHLGPVDLVITSPADRARSTWLIAAWAFPDPPPVTIEEPVYTGRADDLRAIVRVVDPTVRTLVLVGHDPAVSDLVTQLCRVRRHMVTSCLAVLSVPGRWHTLEDAPLPVRAFGRPPEGRTPC